MTWRQILLNKLTLSVKLKFKSHFDNAEPKLPYYDGGDHNTLFLKFKEEEEADRTIRALKEEFNKMRKYKAVTTKEGHLEVKNATKLDTLNKKRKL